MQLADLKPDDRVSVHHWGTETGRVARDLAVERDVEFAGVLRNIDTAKQEMTFAVGEDANPELVTLPYVVELQVTMNGPAVTEQQLLKPSDLRPGDKAKVLRNVQIVKSTPIACWATSARSRRSSIPCGFCRCSAPTPRPPRPAPLPRCASPRQPMPAHARHLPC